MSYQTVAFVSQMFVMVLFGGIFAAVVVYAFWPGNRKHLERASRIPLDGGGDDMPTGGDYERT
jgi:cytochrome c oxidase cbb3-type subunit IV